MKFAVWTYSIAVGLTSLLVITLGDLLQWIIDTDLYRKPMPNITVFFIHIKWWILIVVGPFFFAAFYLNSHSRLTADRAFMFAGLSTLAIVTLLALTALSLIMPFVRVIHLYSL